MFPKATKMFEARLDQGILLKKLLEVGAGCTCSGYRAQHSKRQKCLMATVCAPARP